MTITSMGILPGIVVSVCCACAGVALVIRTVGRWTLAVPSGHATPQGVKVSMTVIVFMTAILLGGVLGYLAMPLG